MVEARETHIKDHIYILNFDRQSVEWAIEHIKVELVDAWNHRKKNWPSINIRLQKTQSKIISFRALKNFPHLAKKHGIVCLSISKAFFFFFGELSNG